MLCYRYSQSAADIIHDTFAWLANNRRAGLSIALPILAVYAVAIFCLKVDIYDIADDTNPLNILLRQTRSFSETMVEAAYAIGAIVGVTTLLLTPLLRRYFVDRRSLYRLTAREAAKELRRQLRHAFAVAVTTALIFYLLEAGMNIFFILILAIGATFLIPCFIMEQWSGIHVFDNLWLIAKTLLFLFLVICLVKSIPNIILWLMMMSLYILNEILPGALYTDGIITDILSYLFSALTCIAFSMASTVYVVCALRLHGAITTPE